MLHAGLDLSRRKIEVCLLSSVGEIVEEWASPADADGPGGRAARASMWGVRVRGVVPRSGCPTRRSGLSGVLCEVGVTDSALWAGKGHLVLPEDEVH
jgi:hypothetical protein